MLICSVLFLTHDISSKQSKVTTKKPKTHNLSKEAERKISEILHEYGFKITKSENNHKEAEKNDDHFLQQLSIDYNVDPKKSSNNFIKVQASAKKHEDYSISESNEKEFYSANYASKFERENSLVKNHEIHSIEKSLRSILEAQKQNLNN
jgi:hypothetical protein